MWKASCHFGEPTTSPVLVVKAEGRIMASVMVGHDGHRGVLYYLAVDPMFQKRGFGRILHNAAVDWLKTRGVWKINLMVRYENKSVSRFNEALGYKINPVASLASELIERLRKQLKSIFKLPTMP
jgi:ribosomal protein S18 acetylase RimI-like enzyme